MQNAGLHKQYYNALKDKGYNAILDINDTRYSGYKNVSKSPAIFFGDDKWEKIASTKLDDTEISDNSLKYVRSYVAKRVAKSLAIYGGVGTAITAINNQKIVKEYIKDHPNTKLSEKEILKNAKKDGY